MFMPSIVILSFREPDRIDADGQRNLQATRETQGLAGAGLDRRLPPVCIEGRARDCVSKSNVLSNAVGAFVFVAAIAMDNTQRKEIVVALVKVMQRDLSSMIALGLAIPFGLLWLNQRRAIGKERME